MDVRTSRGTHLDDSCTVDPIRNILRCAQDLDQIHSPFPRLQPTFVETRYEIRGGIDVILVIAVWSTRGVLALRRRLVLLGELESRIKQVSAEDGLNESWHVERGVRDGLGKGVELLSAWSGGRW
jgi:hypothetical protein